jgi:hypothetical protein
MFCPIRDKECSRDCIWYRSTSRQYTGKVDTVQVEGCAINLILDELQNHSLQNSMQQKEMGEVKNNSIYGVLALTGNPLGVSMLKKKVQHLLGSENASAAKDN